MQSNAFASAVMRRRLLASLALVLTGLLAVGAWSLTGPSYSAEATVVLLPPVGVQPGAKNPYLYLGGLDQARDIAIRSVTGQRIQADVQAAQPDAEYTVEDDPLSSGPILVVTSKGPTQESAMGALNKVLDLVPETLRSLQDQLNVPPAAQIRTLPVTVDEHATVSHKSQLRLVIVAVAGSLALSLLLVGVVDGLLMRRSRSRRAMAVPAPVQAVSDETEQRRAVRGGTSGEANAKIKRRH